MLRPFILSWNLRNVLEDPSILTSDKLTLIGTGLGEYPIDAWKKYFLEIPKDGHKKDITGRFHSVLGIGLENTQWDIRRTLRLPIFSISKENDLKKLKTVIRHWDDICISDDIPCLAIAVKCGGFHSDYREAQSVTVLTLWNDGVGRILSLEWFEGPLEDCITPEWYVETTSLLNLREAKNRMQKIYENTKWDKSTFSIFAIPSCLGSCLHGDIAQTSYNLWDHEWKYTGYAELKDDLNLLLSEVWDIFFSDLAESDKNGESAHK